MEKSRVTITGQMDARTEKPACPLASSALGTSLLLLGDHREGPALDAPMGPHPPADRRDAPVRVPVLIVAGVGLGGLTDLDRLSRRRRRLRHRPRAGAPRSTPAQASGRNVAGGDRRRLVQRNDGLRLGKSSPPGANPARGSRSGARSLGGSAAGRSPPGEAPVHRLRCAVCVGRHRHGVELPERFGSPFDEHWRNPQRHVGAQVRPGVAELPDEPRPRKLAVAAGDAAVEGLAVPMTRIRRGRPRLAITCSSKECR